MENENKPAVIRLYSLDALRGFDMFWIMGGEGIFEDLIPLPAPKAGSFLTERCYYGSCSFNIDISNQYNLSHENN